MISAFSKSSQKGFTLIELLIVIGILGVLAAVLLVAINPLEQFARTRDSGRTSEVTQLGRALAQYLSTQGGIQYVTAGATWMTTLQTSSEITKLITAPVGNGVTACTVNNQNGFCYSSQLTPADAVVWTPAESNSYIARGGCAGATAYTVVVYIESQGKTGVDCLAGAGSTPGFADVLK